uniref:CSON008495 protein n=1 Tax=Culicoides sonorensis TaxID=179676 RepID=A0A336KEH2_CULSO
MKIISGLLNLRIHKKAELILVSKDNNDRQMCHGGLTLIVELKYKDSSSRTIPVQVSDKRDGTYIISFIPDAAGIIILTITINGKPIKDSPFTLRARALKPHTGIYHCCCFCSSGGSKIATCACASTMPGGYKGCGHGHPGHPGRRHWSCCSSVLENSECTVANSGVIHQSTETINQ